MLLVAGLGLLSTPPGFAVAIQCALLEKLEGDSNLTGMIAGVYDGVPQPADSGSASQFPYVTIGEASIVPWDSMSEVGCNATVTIHVWSRQAGRIQTKTIQNAIYQALHHKTLPITAYHVVDVRMINEDSFMDSDGETRHGVQTYRVVLDQLEV